MALYNSIISAWAVVPFNFPFLDIHGVVASSAWWHLGAVLLVGCFFAGQNIAYRGVFLLLALLGLMKLAHSTKGFTSPVSGVAAGIAVFLIWGEPFRVAILTALPRAALVFWLSRELAWWWLIAVLAGLVLCFARESTMGRFAAQFTLLRLLARAPLGLPGGRNPS